jgi:hypothetical protein
MRQGSVRGTVLKKPHGYRFYQTKKRRKQRQYFSSRNKFIGSMKTLENSDDDASLTWRHQKRFDRLLQRVQVSTSLEFFCPAKTVLPGARARIAETSRDAPKNERIRTPRTEGRLPLPCQQVTLLEPRLGR